VRGGGRDKTLLQSTTRGKKKASTSDKEVSVHEDGVPRKWEGKRGGLM